MAAKAPKEACASPAVLDEILEGDCVSALENFPAKSVDLVFADPPYNLQLERRPAAARQSAGRRASTTTGTSSRASPSYDPFTRAWLAAVPPRAEADRRALGDRLATTTSSASARSLQDLGFWILNDVVWRKTNPMPNFRGRRFTNAHETLIWAARDAAPKRYTFNYEAMKALNDDLQMRSDWLFPICTGAERLKDDGRQQGASDAEAGSAAAPRDAGSHEARATSCSTRSSAPARPARWRSGSAATSSASSASRDYVAAARRRHRRGRAGGRQRC